MLSEFIILFFINYAGILISKLLNLPIPGTIIAMILFFVLLQTKILKIEKIEKAATILLANMTILFMPPIVKILDTFQILQEQFVKAFILIILTTFITMGVTGKVVQIMIEFKERKDLKINGGKNERNSH